MSKSPKIFYLYVKTHSITGLQYLGQTTKDPLKYYGSGKYWREHLKKHGREHTTKILHECKTHDELREWGIYYSRMWNVVESSKWANLKEEAGVGGVMGETARKKLSDKKKGCSLSDSTKEKMSMAHKGKIHSEETRQKIGQAHRGKIISKEQREILSKLNTGKPKSNPAKEKLSDTLKKQYRNGERIPAKGMLGKKLSDDAKEKIRQAHLGKVLSEETKEKLRSINRGRTWIVVDGKRKWIDVI